ncbi:glycosyltransferase, partial [Acidobacteriota bacterium]
RNFLGRKIIGIEATNLMEKTVNKILLKKTYDKITILMPCKDQKADFLTAAINSVLNQTSSDWELLIIIDVNSPFNIIEIIQKFSRDPRIKRLVSERDSLANALNVGMGNSTTEFVCILHSDDLLDKRAIETLMDYIKRYPNVDFFHSSRRYVDAKGRKRTKLMPSKKTFAIDYFKKRGSPVKHLLCWRLKKGIEVGGMDEDLTLHGCDDYDFPWKMAEAGSTFKAIKECLYYYRIHHDFSRLTTEVPLDKQIEVIRKIFKKHKVSSKETQDYTKKALKRYLIKDKTIDYGKEDINIITISHFRHFAKERRIEFHNKGYKKSHFFPHKMYFIHKGGPDGLKMAQRMCGVTDPNKLWEIVLYALKPLIDEFPIDLFFDDDIVWHQQQFGRMGQVATANLVIKENNVFGMNYLSDLVQRIARRREYKTRIENKFKGWHHLLLNCIMNFALENNLREFYSPTADLVIAHTDPLRPVKRELFERVYDRTVLKHFLVEKNSGWWIIDVNKNKEKIIIPEKKEEIIEYGKTICICHDIERGWGHRAIDPNFAESVNITSLRSLEEMMAIESEMNIKATYFVLGAFLNEIREEIEKNGHCIAFHSYNHKQENQLTNCRKADYRIKGYRPPQSIISPELSDENLSYYNFEWLASSSNSLKARSHKMQNGIVKIPILFDDFVLHEGKVKYEEWGKKAIDMIKQNYLVTFSLHDCYADHWLQYYREFLQKIRGLGEFKTLNEVANEIILGSSK